MDLEHHQRLWLLMLCVLIQVNRSNPRTNHYVKLINMIPGGPLHFGDIEDLGTTTEDADCLITCPWHAFRYSLIDGTSPEDEDHDALVFETRIIKSDGDGVMVVEVCVDGDRGVERVEWIPEPGTNDLTVESSETIITQTLETMTLSIPNTTSSKHPQHPETLAEWASLILRTPNAQDKVDLTYKVASMWNSGDIKEVCDGCYIFDASLMIVCNRLVLVIRLKCRIDPQSLFSLPQHMPGNVAAVEHWYIYHALYDFNITHECPPSHNKESRIAILHALANIEQWAIDLAWDLISRFPCLPHALYTDFVRIATEEAHHFELLVSRLTRLGSFYGALSVHGSLWDSALETRHDILARLAIVHMYVLSVVLSVSHG